jgi:hypothetical protein
MVVIPVQTGMQDVGYAVHTEKSPGPGMQRPAYPTTAWLWRGVAEKEKLALNLVVCLIR